MFAAPRGLCSDGKGLGSRRASLQHRLLAPSILLLCPFPHGPQDAVCFSDHYQALHQPCCTSPAAQRCRHTLDIVQWLIPCHCLCIIRGFLPRASLHVLPALEVMEVQGPSAVLLVMVVSRNTQPPRLSFHLFWSVYADLGWEAPQAAPCGIALTCPVRAGSFFLFSISCLYPCPGPFILPHSSI